MPAENTSFSNELILSRVTPPIDGLQSTYWCLDFTPPIDALTGMDFSKIVNIHRDTQVSSHLIMLANNHSVRQWFWRVIKNS